MKFAKILIGLAAVVIAVFSSTYLFESEEEEKKEPAMSELKISSPSFENGDNIPVKFTCQGENTSPEINWSGIPEGTESLVLIMDDPDAPDPAAPKIVWVHWVLYNIPHQTSGIKENIQAGELPAGTLEGINSWGKTGYGGPCPPIGNHRYFFKLFCISEVLPDMGNPTKDELLASMEGKIIGSAEIIGMYKKQQL